MPDRAPNRRLAFVAVALAMACQGCASYQIRVPDSDPNRGYRSATMHSYFWGLTMDPQVLGAECEGQGINDVFVDRNFGHDLISVFSLGLWSPLDVRFRCHAGPVTGGTFPVPSQPR
jgi:hypothetical protein